MIHTNFGSKKSWLTPFTNIILKAISSIEDYFRLEIKFHRIFSYFYSHNRSIVFAREPIAIL